MKVDDIGILEYHRRILQLPPPWEVIGVDLDMETKAVNIEISYPRDTHGFCPECGILCPINDRRKKKWRHLSQMQLQTFIECPVPRTDCLEHGVHQILVPWAEPNGRFTILFEDFAIQLIKACANLTQASDLLGISWDAIQSIQKRAVERGLLKRHDRVIKNVGLDEKSYKKGQSYISVLSDLNGSKVIEVVEGRELTDAEKLLNLLSEKQKEGVEAVAVDMLQAFQSAIEKVLPQALITHDKFHISSYLNKAVNSVRYTEHKEFTSRGHEILKNTKHLWLTNKENLRLDQKKLFRTFRNTDLKVGRAYAMKESFRNFWGYTNLASAMKFYKEWYFWVTHSKLKPMIKVAKMIQRHLPNIITYFKTRLTNAVAEGINSKIQIIKASARGFRNFENYRISILFHCGGLKMRPHE